MLLDDAAAVSRHLLAGFPAAILDEEQVELFVKEVALLADAGLGMDAAIRIVRTHERFPTIKEFRQVYGSLLARQEAADESRQRALEPAPENRAELVAEIRAFADRLGTPRDDGEKLPAVDEGECQDRCGHVGERVQQGQLRLCRSCAASRRRVAALLKEKREAAA